MAGLARKAGGDSAYKCFKLGFAPQSPTDTEGHYSLEGMAYLDNNATTALDPRVLDAMFQVYKGDYGNPHSRGHVFGWRAEFLVEEARERVAKVINANKDEIIFTSGATESNNLAIKGLANFHKSAGKRRHIVTLATEHKCVIEACRSLSMEGFKVDFLTPEQNGLLDLDKLKAVLSDETLMVSVMAVNNEIGVIQDLAQIGAITRERGIFFHTDVAQAFGKIPLDVEAMNIDLASISGHKIYGPKGIGALYVRKTPRRVRLAPLFSGGGQERGLRSGTLPTALVSGFGLAAKLCQDEFGKDHKHVADLSKKLYNGIMSIPKVFLNGDLNKRYPGNLNFSFLGIEGESLIMALKEVAVSSGSACTSASLEPSYVLHALGVKDELAHSSIRFGIGRFTTEQDIEKALKIRDAVERLRAMSPVWDMIEAGIDLDSVSWNAH